MIACKLYFHIITFYYISKLPLQLWQLFWGLTFILSFLCWFTLNLFLDQGNWSFFMWQPEICFSLWNALLFIIIIIIIITEVESKTDFELLILPASASPHTKIAGALLHVYELVCNGFFLKSIYKAFKKVRNEGGAVTFCLLLHVFLFIRFSAVLTSFIAEETVGVVPSQYCICVERTTPSPGYK